MFELYIASSAAGRLRTRPMTSHDSHCLNAILCRHTGHTPVILECVVLTMRFSRASSRITADHIDYSHRLQKGAAST